MAHESPTPILGSAAEARQDARLRALRTVAHALAVTALVGASTAVYQLAAGGEALDLVTVGTTAGTGALMAVGAWVHRRLEAVLDR